MSAPKFRSLFTHPPPPISLGTNIPKQRFIALRVFHQSHHTTSLPLPHPPFLNNNLTIPIFLYHCHYNNHYHYSYIHTGPTTTTTTTITRNLPTDNMATSDTYSLIYWPGIPGRGEHVRLALEEGGAAYTDTAHTPEAAIRDVTAQIADDNLGDDVNPPPLAPPICMLSQTSTNEVISFSPLLQAPCII